jgi:hypothetical protein
MNKQIMKDLGFADAAKDVENGVCPFCKKVIIPLKEFRDEQSVKEYEISGLCQACQDKYFGV